MPFKTKIEYGASNSRYEYRSEKEKQDAIVSVRENPDQVNAHIESLRRWLKSMPHLKSPTNADFLIKFLRVAKYEHSKAQTRLDNFCTVRASGSMGNPELFLPSKVTPELIDLCIGTGHMTPVGLTEKNQLLIVMRLGRYDPTKIAPTVFFPVIYYFFDYMAEKYPEMSYNGITMFFDCTHFSARDMILFRDQKIMKNMMKIWQDCYPIRHESLVYYNEPVILDVVFRILELWMKPKIKEKMHRIKENKHLIPKFIPGCEKILPVEYGGQNREPLDTILARNIAELKEYWAANKYPLADITVDESKRPANSMGHLKQYKDVPESMWEMAGTQGTVTKLDI